MLKQNKLILPHNISGYICDDRTASFCYNAARTSIVLRRGVQCAWENIRTFLQDWWHRYSSTDAWIRSIHKHMDGRLFDAHTSLVFCSNPKYMSYLKIKLKNLNLIGLSVVAQVAYGSTIFPWTLHNQCTYTWLTSTLSICTWYLLVKKQPKLISSERSQTITKQQQRYSWILVYSSVTLKLNCNILVLRESENS